MADQPPLDLRSLLSVETPEVVSDALRRFRRRLVARGLWAALGVLVAVLAVLALRSNRGLPEQIMSAPRISYPSGATYDIKGVRFAVLEVADLGSGDLGVHLAAAPDPGSSTEVGTLKAPGIVGDARTSESSSDWWLEIAKPSDGVITIDARMSPCAGGRGCIGSFEIDLGALGVPSDFWR
jgi:hypothetical protein